MTSILSVVVPTYNRGPKLAATIDCLLASDTRGLGSVEIIVVDDGSTTPVSSIVESHSVVAPFTLRYIKQANMGPAAARNTGFRASQGKIVLFVDDDILALPNMLRLHGIAHAERPNSVICGRCTLAPPNPVTPLYNYLESLDNDPGADAQKEFYETRIVASGQISVVRELFKDAEGVYCDNLVTPSAEEFELSYRLSKREIPVLVATRITARHDSPVDIASICRQQYTYGIGFMEASGKYPEICELPELSIIRRSNRKQVRGEPSSSVLRQHMKELLSGSTCRGGLLRLTRLVERLAPKSIILPFLYRRVIGLHFFAGIQEGLERFPPAAFIRRSVATFDTTTSVDARGTVSQIADTQSN